MFTFGGVTGILLGCSSMVLALHDTYYVVAHFHVVLSLSTVMGLILGLSMYIDMVLVHGVVGSIFVQCNNSSMLCYCSVLLLIYGTCLCFIMMHYIGFAMLPRRIFDYPDSINCWNCLCSIGACICFVCFVSLKR
jgi:cytochrome c oxidase subunit 1